MPDLRADLYPRICPYIFAMRSSFAQLTAS